MFRLFFVSFILIIFSLFATSIVYYSNNSLYNIILNPIEIDKELFIFSSILERSRIRILLFLNNLDYNQSDKNKNLYCYFKELRSTNPYKSHLVRYSAVHNKYYNLFCNIPTNSNLSYFYVSNKQIWIFSNYKFKKYNLLFCLTTMFNYNRTNRFIEFIEYYRNFGVDKFIIYITNCSKQIKI